MITIIWTDSPFIKIYFILYYMIIYYPSTIVVWCNILSFWDYKEKHPLPLKLCLKVKLNNEGDLTLNLLSKTNGLDKPIEKQLNDAITDQLCQKAAAFKATQQIEQLSCTIVM